MAAHPPTQEKRKYMQIYVMVKMDQLDEFRTKIASLLEESKDVALEEALSATPRSTAAIVAALTQLSNPDLIGEYPAGTADSASLLLEIYAELVGAGIVKFDGNIEWIEWGGVSPVDDVTI